MIFCRYIFFIFISIQISFAKAQERIEIHFLEKVELTQKNQLKLLDLIYIKNPNSKILQDLQNIDWPFGDSVQNTELTQWIKKILIQNEELKKQNPLFKIPSEIKVSFVKNLSENELKRKIQIFAQLQCAECEVTVLQIQRTVLHNISKHWDLDYSAVKIQSQQLIPILIDQQPSSYWLTVSTRFSAPVLTVKKPIFLGERVQNADVDLVRQDITFLKDPVFDLQSVIGRKAIRTLSPGGVVAYQDLKKEPDILKGQLLKAILHQDQLQIQWSVVSEQVGQVGDTIKVKNLDNSKIFSAVILDAESVRIQ